MGTGDPPVILLHGLTATGALNWGPSFGPLGRRYRTLALDHRGHGRGIRPPAWRGFHLSDCADDVMALADELDLPKVLLVGYSMGGPIAQLAWRRHPDRVAGLVLCATSRNFGGTTRNALRLAMAGGITGAATAIRTMPPPVRRQLANAGMVWRRRAFGVPEWALEELGRNDPAAVLEAVRALQHFDSRPWIGEVDVPTAVVVTTEDRVVPPERQRRMAAAIPGASVWEVHGDHAVCVLGAPRFVPTLLEACDWVARGGTRSPGVAV
ncbi:MAG: alpha/beta fold hydrolase [Acidimicrobiales bacterium]